MSAGAHPSFLELDRYALGEARPETHDHVQGCAQCRAHVQRVREPEPPPAWLRDPQALRQKTKKTPWWSFFGGGLVLVAAAASILVGIERPDYVGVKGAPDVRVVVRRAEHTFVWDGQAPLRAGDRVRLEVAPEGFRHVTVAAQSTRTGTPALELLADEALPQGKATLLTPTWSLDDSPGPEVLVVIFADRALALSDVRAFVQAPPPADTAWVRRLEIPKSAAR